MKIRENIKKSFFKTRRSNFRTKWLRKAWRICYKSQGEEELCIDLQLHFVRVEIKLPLPVVPVMVWEEKLVLVLLRKVACPVILLLLK